MIRRTACLLARGTDPYRNLAIEKHLMDTLPEETAILYLWQNERCVVIGRNQNPWYELKVDEFLRSGGKLARRMSGGGAVYHDLGNLNFTLIVPKSEFSIPRQLQVVAMAVGMLGVRAEASGRNDLTAAGRKFSGNAFYKAGSAAYHHGTLMVRADLEALADALTVDPQKLQSHMGVASVASRVVNLSDLNPAITVEALEAAMYEAFARVYGARPATLDERMMDAPTLDALARWFQSPDWLYPEDLSYGFSVSERFPWGGVTMLIKNEGGVIRKAKIYTDAMEAALFNRLEAALTGCPFLIGAIETRFEQCDEMLGDARLSQLLSDLCTLVCGRIRAMDRGGEA